MKRLLSGIKPTGDLTLGNYLGAIKEFVKLQNDYESFVFVADMHALTIQNNPQELNEKIKKMVAIYLASGLDPKKTTIFIQSENLYHANLSWIMESNVHIGELSRMIQFKEKTKAKNEDSVNASLFTYPALMAADILMYDADIVPVGIDQKQHVEIARDIATRFNNTYGETFKLPEALINKNTEKIYDLQEPTKKMSKSGDNDKGIILLLDDPEIARKKIMSAVTDSDNKIIMDYQNKPGISNLITIYSALTNESIKDVERHFADTNYGKFKNEVADVVVNFLKDLQDKYNKIINSEQVNEVLDEGLKKVIPLSKQKVTEVFNKVGLGR